MNKKLLALSVTSLIGLGVMTGFASANEIIDVIQPRFGIGPKKICENLTEEQKAEMEEQKAEMDAKREEMKALQQEKYNALTDEEKAVFDKFCTGFDKDMMELSREERIYLKDEKLALLETATDEEKEILKQIKEKMFVDKAEFGLGKIKMKKEILEQIKGGYSQ